MDEIFADATSSGYFKYSESDNSYDPIWYV